MNKTIPDVLSLNAPNGTRPLPVVFDSPHSGTVYPGDFVSAVPKQILRKGEDTFVHELFGAAPDHGASLLHAHFPRAYIDANRPEDDLDEALLDGPWPGPLNPGVKTASGIGLIWRLAQPGLPIYDRKLSVPEVKARIENYHRPYQQTLAETVDRLHADLGSVWHLNCHSMPALSDDRSPEGSGVERPDFCLGDRDGTTCAPEFTEFVAATLRGLGYRTTINDPYKGVELVRMVGRPDEGRHSLQIEINRRLHIDEETKEKNGGFGKLQADVTTLIAAICDYARERAGVSP